MTTVNFTPDVGFRVQTGLLATEVTSHDGVYTWQHRLGAHAPVGFSTLAPSGKSKETHDSELVIWGQGDNTSRSYRTHAGSSLAIHLLDPQPVKLRAIGKLWGAALNEIHNVRPASKVTFTKPRTLQRAAAWLDGSWKPARTVLGSAGLSRLVDWAIRMGEGPHRVLVHGCPGMAHWVMTSDAREGSLLTGEDAGVASPIYDFGWVLGEITELRAFHPLLGTGLNQLEEGLLDCFPEVPNLTDLNLARAFRLVHHAFDWHHYAGASIEQAALLLRLARNYIYNPVGTDQEIS